MNRELRRAEQLARTRLPKATFLHSVRVAERLGAQGECEAIVLAGLLHDVVEDGGVELAEIRRLFGDRVAEAVDAVSRRDGETYSAFIHRAAAHPDGRLVKQADVRDNLGRPGGAASLRKRYRTALEVLADVSFS
jgi:(p)ppGpp synthase/HD superfamily hydrolase